MLQNIKAILFDLDDTILDDTYATLTYRQTFYNRHRRDIPHSFDTFYGIWETTVTSDLAAVSKGAVRLIDARRNRIRTLFGAAGMRDIEADQYIEEYLYLYEAAWTLFDDAMPLLDKIRNRFLLGIVTNGDREQQWRKIRKFGLSGYFDTIITGEDAHASKPEKAIFDTASSRLNVENAQCLFIGDGYEKDVVGSLNAGMQPIWLQRNAATSGQLPGLITIQTLTEALTIINGN